MLERHSFNHFIIPLGYKGSMVKNYLKKFIDLKDSNIETIDTGINSTIANRIYLIKKKS